MGSRWWPYLLAHLPFLWHALPLTAEAPEGTPLVDTGRVNFTYLEVQVFPEWNYLETTYLSKISSFFLSFFLSFVLSFFRSFFRSLFRSFFLLIIFYLFLRERDRDRTRVGEGQRERGRHRIGSRLQAPSCQHRAQCRSWTHEPWDQDLSRSWMLYQLSHLGTPKISF